MILFYNELRSNLIKDATENHGEDVNLPAGKVVAVMDDDSGDPRWGLCIRIYWRKSNKQVYAGVLQIAKLCKPKSRAQIAQLSCHLHTAYDFGNGGEFTLAGSGFGIHKGVSWRSRPKERQSVGYGLYSGQYLLDWESVKKAISTIATGGTEWTCQSIGTPGARRNMESILQPFTDTTNKWF